MSSLTTHQRLFPGIPLVESPLFNGFADECWSGETLRVARELHEQGYAIIDFPDPDLPAKIDQLIETLTPLYPWQRWREGREGSLRIQDLWLGNPLVRELATNPTVLALLSDLYGRRAFPFQTLNFPVGTQQPSHSDHVHFHSVPERFMCGVWIAMEDINEDNGPLFVYPGSNRWPLLSNESLGINGAMLDDPYTHYHRYVEAWDSMAAAQGIAPKRFIAKKGQALIWSAGLVHGGSKMADKDRTRWSMVTHYFFEGCAYTTPMANDPYHGEIYFRDVTDVATGERMPNVVSGKAVAASFQAQSMPHCLRPRADRRPTSALPAELPQDFDDERYLCLNPDVRKAGVNPRHHWIHHGRFEGRQY
ncbi:phytanoyl-CoA dioxygenase family protein [Hydrogenophaga sp.]|jgi:hypothetical protein|uniref:phytanoyl-CoA dioxygenase family protein n=1 Tax=Hydrogenophaga sp. TaxID=1904254 RepID=UPI00391B187A